MSSETEPTTEVTEVKSPTLAKIETNSYRVPRVQELPPLLPALMRMPAADLTDEQVDQMLAERKTYREAQAAYQALLTDREAMVGLMEDQLRTDLQTEFGITDEAKGQLLFNLCKSYAEGDLVRLFGFYDDLHILVK